MSTLRTLTTLDVWRLAFMLGTNWHDRLAVVRFALRYDRSTPAERRVIRRQVSYRLALLEHDQTRKG